MTGSETQWLPPSSGLNLADDEVHVWRAGLDPPTGRFQQLAGLLSHEETARADRFHFERDRRRFIVARGILRSILGMYLHEEAARIRFRYRPQGKPHLARTHGEGSLHFNLSHSHELMLLACTRDREIGIDLERVRPLEDMEQIATRFFSAYEASVLHTLDQARRLEAFYNCWTRKEAFLKAIGTGLARPLDQFDVSLTPGDPAKLLRVQDDPHEAERWSIYTPKPGSDYVAAVVVAGQSWRVRCWQWPGSIA